VQDGNRLSGEEWRRSGAGRQHLEITGLPGRVASERLTALDQEGRRLALTWYWIDGHFTGDPLRALAIHIGQRLIGRDEPAAIIALSAPYGRDPSEALAVITRFLRESQDLGAYLETVGAASAPRG
jgi:EpsI family protein